MNQDARRSRIRIDKRKNGKVRGWGFLGARKKKRKNFAGGWRRWSVIFSDTGRLNLKKIGQEGPQSHLWTGFANRRGGEWRIGSEEARMKKKKKRNNGRETTLHVRTKRNAAETPKG